MVPDQQTAAEVEFLHVSDHYDHHLSGWLRLSGFRHRLHFRLSKTGWVPDSPGDVDSDGHYDTEWSVYAVPPAVAAAHLRHARLFRNMVWWGWDYDPRAGSCHSAPKRESPGATKDAAAAFYRLPRIPDVDLAACRLVGTTSDLRTVTLARDFANA